MTLGNPWIEWRHCFVVRSVDLYERSGKFSHQALVNLSGVHDVPAINPSDAAVVLVDFR